VTPVAQLETARKGQNNLAFASLLQLGDAKACVDLLVNTDRAPEAALFARTYTPRYILLDVSVFVWLILCTF
jgi:Coatomer WD associated region